MTHDEMIAVIQAHKEGKKIQVRNSYGWQDVDYPTWNFADYSYRIKPEPHYRPFKNAKEVMGAIKEHGNLVKFKYDGKSSFSKAVIVEINDDEFYFGQDGMHPLDFDSVDTFTFEDGTPFGVLE